MLDLYTDLNEAWIERFLAFERVCGDSDYNDVCIRFYQSFKIDSLLVDFAARSATMFEPHVSQIAWIAAKQSQSRIAKRLGGMFCWKFKCGPSTGQRLAWAFLAGLSGAQQRAIDAHDRADIPADLQKLSGVMTSREVFLNMVLPLKPNAKNENSPFQTLLK